MTSGERYGLVAIAIAAGVDFDKAWTIVDEAETAGSTRDRAERVYDAAHVAAWGDGKTTIG